MIHHSLSPGHTSSWAQFKCALVWNESPDFCWLSDDHRWSIQVKVWKEWLLWQQQRRFRGMLADVELDFGDAFFLLPLYSSPGPTEFNNSGPELNSHPGHHHGARRQRWAPQLFPTPLNVFTRECAASELLHVPTTWWCVVGMMMWLAWWCWHNDYGTANQDSPP